MRSIIVLLIALFYISACSNDSTEVSQPTAIVYEELAPISNSNLSIPDNRFSNNYQIIIFGNSHVAGLNDIIQSLIKAGNPSAEINILNVGGGFLDDSHNKQKRIFLLEKQHWTHVILQGQKYSQSGDYTYPTESAEKWIEMAKNQETTPILFPEHPRKGNTVEAKRVHQIHINIASEQRTCVAPVGLAWDKVISINPSLLLHHNDGNHAALMGRLLTAYVFYEVITGESADLLPFVEEIAVEESTQLLLKQLASETIQSNQPCLFDA